MGQTLFDTEPPSRLPEEVCDPLHAQPGVPCPGPTTYVWQPDAVFRPRYACLKTSLLSTLLIIIIGVEKNNDVAKHTYYSSNKHDPCGEVIRMERRQDTLQHCKREKRPYHKNDTDYWTSGILEQRKRQRET